MASTVRIPPRANLERTTQFVVPDGLCHAGETVRYTWHRVPEGYADAGKVIITMKVGGLAHREAVSHPYTSQCRECGALLRGSWQYTGRNVDKAEAQWSEVLVDISTLKGIEAASGTPAESARA